MKRFRLKDHSYIKYAFAILLLIAVFNFGAVTGFVVNAPGEKRIIDITLASEDVREFLLANPDFKVTVKGLSAESIKELEKIYPPLYSSLPDGPLYEVLYYSDAGSILVITDSERVLRIGT